MKVKKYNYPNMMFVNKFTYGKLVTFANEIALMRLHWELKTIKDFKIVVREELEDNMVYFYIRRRKNGEIIRYKFEDLLKDN